MAALIHHQITNALQAAAGLYHRLVLLVGEAGSGKSAVLRDIAAGYGTHVININLALASELVELSPRQRMLRLP
jgi:predicted ATPase